MDKWVSEFVEDKWASAFAEVNKLVFEFEEYN